MNYQIRFVSDNYITMGEHLPQATCKYLTR